MIETERLILRRWRSEDLDPYAAMMVDPEVADWLSGVQTRENAEDAIARMEAQRAGLGYAGLAVERREDGAFLGAVGLSPLGEDHGPSLRAGTVEIGWRLARAFWRFGYATEAARAVLEDGFERLGLPEIVAFTAASNTRSRAVMQRLGFTRQAWRDFDHPNLAPDHPLRPHVVYAISKD